MSTNTPSTDYQYTQLDLRTYLSMLQQRIRDQETQYATLALRIATPAPTDVITEMDHQNLATLSANLETLHSQEANIKEQLAAVPTPAPTPPGPVAPTPVVTPTPSAPSTPSQTPQG